MAEEEEIIKIVEVEKKVSWYNNAEGFDKWRVFPRILITLYGLHNQQEMNDESNN